MADLGGYFCSADESWADQWRKDIIHYDHTVSNPSKSKQDLDARIAQRARLHARGWAMGMFENVCIYEANRDVPKV